MKSNELETKLDNLLKSNKSEIDSLKLAQKEEIKKLRDELHKQKRKERDKLRKDIGIYFYKKFSHPRVNHNPQTFEDYQKIIDECLDLYFNHRYQ